MHASVIEGKFKPGTRDEALAKVDGLVDELSSKVEGLRAFIILDRGDDRSTTIALYETKENWEAAAPVAADILGQMGPYFAEMPERTGCEVMLAKRFVTD